MKQNISSKILLEKLTNTRDLGGMKTSDGGTIKAGRLIRSGQLYFASSADIETLNKIGIKKIFDFRSSEERNDKPDPEISGSVNIHMPIVRELTPGISREKKADKKSMDLILQNSVKDPSYGINYMANTYRTFITDDYALSQYSSFMNQLCDLKEGASLWHCTAGKDRAGFAAVLVQETLGVHRDDIFEDYLSTNHHLKEEIDMIVAMLAKKPGLENADQAIRDFFGAREEYLASNYALVQEMYGGMGNFISCNLKVDINKFRENYLD